MNDKFQDEFSKWETENYSGSSVEINKVEENVQPVESVQNNAFNPIDQKISQPQMLPSANQILAQSNKIDFSAGTKSLESDEGYQTYLKDFYAEYNSPEQVRKRHIRRFFGWGLIVFAIIIGLMSSFSPRGVDMDGIGFIIICGIILLALDRKPNEFGYRASKFAQENNLIIIPQRTVVAENSFFDQNTNANYTNFYREHAFAGQGFEFGLMHYETGGKHSTHYRTFYFEKTLPFAVQNLVIDSKMISRVNISREFNKNLVNLEGDFHDYFDIQTDEDRKMEATAFLAPDLMNALITDFSTCDIELFDNKIRFYFVADIDDLSEPANIFAMFERNMNVVKNFLERFESKFVHLKTEWRAISGGQNLSETKPKFIGIRARNVQGLIMGGVFLFIISIMSFMFGMANFASNVDISVIAIIVSLVIFCFMVIYIVKSVRYFSTTKIKTDYGSIAMSLYVAMIMAIMCFFAISVFMTSRKRVDNVGKQETSLPKTEIRKSEQPSEENLTVSKRVDVIYDRISDYKDLQGGEIDWEDEVQMARLRAKIPYSFEVVKTSEESFAVVPEEIYLVKGKVCGENPLKDFSYHSAEAALFVGLGEKTICRQL